MSQPTKSLGGRIAAPVRVTLPTMNNALKYLAPGASGNQPAGGEPSAAITLIMHDSFAAPAAASATAFISTGVAGPNTTTKTEDRVLNSSDWNGTLGGTGIPNVPRNVVVTVTHATSVVAVSGTITGIDRYGRALTEAWSVTATGTSKTYTGKKAFYRVDSITITAATDASADTVQLGTGAVLGLKMPVSATTIVGEMMDAAATTAGTLAIAAANPADPLGTYTPNTAPNGTHNYDVWYLCDDPSTF
jgi:hypothetical protein